MRDIVRGYPIPRARQKHIIWVNGTPHLSRHAASEHSQALHLYSYQQSISLLRDFLLELLDSKYADWVAMAYAYAEKGEKSAERYFRDLVSRQETSRSSEYMLDKLLEDALTPAREPAFAGKEEKIERQVFDWATSLPEGPLKNYELKLMHKYLGEANTRTGSGYMAQIRSYLPSRAEFRSMPMPNIEAYERALSIHYNSFALPEHITPDGIMPMDTLKGYLSRARKTTFGGYPYLANMADFVSDVGDVTYADWYNQLAIAYLFLSPEAKVYFAYDFIALERVQAGGVEGEIDTAEESLIYKKKPNKQRFVQAQSAVISHAMKFFVDGMTERMRRITPDFVADKFGEANVTQMLKTMVKRAFPKQRLHPDATALINIVGTDFTNYDAHQDISVSNDTAYQCWRLLSPSFMTEFLIDPYIKIVYREGRILVPKYGYVQTTGVRSGMVDTNQTDTLNCSHCDYYELIRYEQDHPESSFAQDAGLKRMCEESHAANGDDRAKLSPCNAEDLERYDWELGYIAQKQKQELLLAGQPLRSMNVTYLKTIICEDPLNPAELVRTDSISKLILSKLSPERKRNYMPYSLVVDFFMSASRSVDSPYLATYVDFMYVYLPVFRSLVDGQLTLDQIVARMVQEQMEELRLRKGKAWMARKGVNYDYVIEQMNIKYGYGDEGYRGNAEALVVDQNDGGLAALPAVQAILTLAYTRKAQGVLGSVFI